MYYKCPLCKEINRETIIRPYSQKTGGSFQKDCVHTYSDIALRLALQNQSLKARLAMEREFSQELIDELEDVLDPSDYAGGI